MDSKKEKLLKKTYDDYIELMLYDFPVKKIGDLIAEDVSGYGTTVDEKFLEIKGFKKVVTDQREQGAGIKMHFRITPIHRRVSSDEDTAIFMDEIEITMVIDGAKNVIPLRLTSVFEFLENNWKLVHIHGSKAVETEGDTWHLDEWKKKNEQLQRLVDEKTFELLKKNRELEIETALEKVRAIAMGMKKPEDMLEVCQNISEQLSTLDVKEIRNVQTAVIYESKGTYFNYEFYLKHNKTFITEVDYKTHELQNLFANQMLNGAEELFTRCFRDKELRDWYEYQKTTDQFADPLLETADSLNYYWYSLGPVALGMSTYIPLNEQEINLFKRFRNVFELSYKRYIDIAQAEAQAREAEIQLALERVRAKSLAMQQTSELQEVVNEVAQQLLQMRIDMDGGVIIIINNEVDKDVPLWGSAGAANYVQKVTAPYLDIPIINRMISAIKKGESFLIERYTKEEKDEFMQHLFQHHPWDKMSQERKSELLSREGGYCRSMSISLHTSIAIINHHGRAFSEEDNNILKRFGNVLEQSYTRFLDLKNAEAQAREAQIETALERVRSRTMGMQKSEELKEVIKVVYEQFIQLQINVDHAGFVVEYTPKGDWHFWIADERDIPSKITHPYFESVWANQFNEAKEKGTDFFTTNLNFEEKNKFYNDLLSYVPGLPEVSKDFYLSCPGLAATTVLLEDVGLYIENFSGIRYTDEENNTLMRFGKVFQQTYTRFLDLQKAETQAREAQIELSLERIRARTMSMQKSDELSETARVLFQQFKELGEDPDQLSIGIVNESEKVIEIWLSLQGNIMNRMFKAPIDEPTVINKIYTAWKEKRKLVIIDISGEELEKYNRYLNSDVDFKEYNVVKNRIGREEHRRIIYTALFSKGLLSVATQEPRSEETVKILERFAGVFDGTYTRFLDLQKAEAQAREAQIETALEKVRSRSLAMHKSDELNEVVSVLFEKLKELQIPFTAVGIALTIEGSKDLNAFVCGENEAGLVITNYRLPYFDHIIANDLNNALEKQLDFFVGHYSKVEKDSFYTYVIEHTLELRHLPQDIKRMVFESTSYTVTMIAVNNATFYINDFEGKVLSEVEVDIIKRFARVFDQAYTRFLDLQKAEAQTREAHIELSLERIRAQVTAMRESPELLDIVVTMRNEFVALGHEAHYFWHMRWLPDKYEKAMTSGDGTRIGMVMTLPRHIHGDIKLVADWEKSDEPSVILAMDVETAVDYVEKMITVGDFQQVDPQAPTLDDIRHIGGLTFVMARTTHGEIGYSLPGTVLNPPAETIATLVRFAGVFDLAYKRFIDLQNAEQQNRIIQADNDRKTKELEDARKLQLSMLPTELPQIPNLDIAVYMKTATEVGGDYYDFNVDAAGTLTVVVGDATGHGMMSGMMVSIMKSFFISNRSSIELKNFFENANNSIKDMNLGRLMMALISVQITSEKIIATNAGMPSLLYFRKKSQKAGEFVSNNLPLGGMKGTKYLLKAVRYEKGDTILLMSDGFAELKNLRNEQYGYTRIKEKFRSLVHKSSVEIIEELKTTASQWTNASEPDDDVTFVVIKFL